MKIINLYEGFEGEPEIVVTEESSSREIIFKVQLLDFHFNEVLSFILLDDYNAESVVYNYFRSTGWHDGKWECRRIEEFYGQLLEMSNSVPLEYLKIYDTLKQVVLSALDNSNKLFINLE